MKYLKEKKGLERLETDQETQEYFIKDAPVLHIPSYPVSKYEGVFSIYVEKRTVVICRVSRAQNAAFLIDIGKIINEV